MNKLITTLFIFIMCYGISAQTEQGQFLMLGETSFQSTTTQPVIYSTIDGDTPDGFEASDYTVNNATATVGLGYLLTKNIAFGIIGRYTSESVNFDDPDIEEDDPYTTTQYGVFSRYYIAGIAFIGASYSMLTTNAWDDWPAEEVPSISVLGVEAGFSLFISKNVALVPSVSYFIQDTQQTIFDQDFQSGSGNLKIELGLNIHL